MLEAAPWLTERAGGAEVPEDCAEVLEATLLPTDFTEGAEVLEAELQLEGAQAREGAKGTDLEGAEVLEAERLDTDRLSGARRATACALCAWAKPRTPGLRPSVREHGGRTAERPR